MIKQNQIGARILLAGILTLAGPGSALPDVITLKSGETIHCTFLSGTSRSVRVEVNGALKTYDLGQVAILSFIDGDSGAPEAGTHPPASVTAKAVIPANTNVLVRVVEPVDSSSSHPGQTFAAATDEPVVVNGTEVIPKDSPVQIRIVSESMSVGQASLTVVLTTITVNGKVVPISSSDVKSSASSSGSNQEVSRIGGGTSAIAGIAGMLGAGRTVTTVGSATSGAIGAGNQLVVHGPKVKIPAGSRLIFRTQSQASF